MSAQELKYHTIAETAEILRVTQWEVTKLCRSGALEASKPGKYWLITPAAIRAYVEASSNQVEAAS